jgi:hypothetical protein
MRRYSLTLLALPLAAAIALAGAWVAAAEKVRCPVCGEVFDDEKVCPNDGTDLSLAGEPVEEQEPDAGEEVEPEEPEEPEEIPEEEGDPKYKRHDHGGDRERADTENGSSYSDRHKRIGEERRGKELAAERRRKAREKRREEFEEQDDQLRIDFELRRRQEWSERREREYQDWHAEQQLVAVRQQSLWGRAAPFTSLGVRMSWMGEGTRSGPVTGAEIDLNLIKTKMRLGLSTLIGVRALEERNDIVFLEHVSIGIQRPWRFSPFLVARGGIGALVSNRFDETVTYLIRSVGVEGGLDNRLTESVVVSSSFGYVRYMIDDAYWDSFTVKLSVGF